MGGASSARPWSSSASSPRRTSPRCLSQQFGVPSINLAHFEIDPSVIKLIPADVARKYNILPVNKTGATLTIAMADPTNVFAMDDIKFMTGYNVEPVVASEVGAPRGDRQVLRHHPRRSS